MHSSVRTVFTALVVLTSCDVLHAAAADPAHDAADLKTAVLDGRSIRMTLDLSECAEHGTDKAGPSIRGSLAFDAFMVQSDQTVAFSKTHFTLRSDKTPVTEFLSFRVRPTGQIEAQTSFLNPATYAVLHETEFDCEVGKGATFHW